MAEKKGFDLAAALGGVSGLDTNGREQIEYFNIDLIDDDPKNFYELSGLDELAANIEMFGLQQPLRVRTNPKADNRLIIVSGHRRRAAIRILVNAGKSDFQEVACIRERAGGSTALQELRVIFGNSDTRRMSSADLGKQAERVEALLYQLKEEGYEFPGRMRDHVAQACKVSTGKLARLKVIKEHLADKWRPIYEKGTLSESTAYTLAQMPPPDQNVIFDGLQKKKTDLRWFYEHTAERLGKKLAEVNKISCKKAGGTPCTNRAAMAAQVVYANDYSNPCAKCCNSCDALATCKHACPQLAEKVKKLREDKKAARQQEALAQATRDKPEIDAIALTWARFAQLRAKSGKPLKAFFDAINMYFSGQEEKEFERKESLKIKKDDRLPFGYGFCLSDAQKLCKSADFLGCSIDYLLGRGDDPTPWAPTWHEAGKKTPDEGQFIFGCDKWGVIHPAVYFGGQFMDSTGNSTANVEVRGIELWMARPALPAGRKWQGQNTIEGLTGSHGKDGGSGNDSSTKM